MEFSWYRFDEFGPKELYSILALRQDILVVEQKSPYPDLDFVDQTVFICSLRTGQIWLPTLDAIGRRERSLLRQLAE
jgi:ElaA protein